MVFSSLLFLFFFLPTFLAVYWVVPSGWKNGWALIASALFYAWGAPQFLPVIVLTSLLDYVVSHQLVRPDRAPRTKRLMLMAAIGVNLAVLGYCKYSNFFVDQLNAILHTAGVPPLHWAAVALPIGISFLTFEKISYLVDVARGVTPPAPTLGTYALFLGLFPHLIAGPIFRYHDIANQLLSRTHSTELFFEGFQRFSLGLGKKVLVADPLSSVVDTAFGLRFAALSTPVAWYGALAYALQIYYDFSGYSDMAIGLGRMCGFRFLENFNEPYTATSITDFWRRWHISLSNWMREYLYIPLGGNRVGRVRQMANLWIVFLLSGLWHGASWNFIAWGAYHGLFLALERTRVLSWMEKLPRIIRQTTTFLIVLVGWVPFRALTLNEAKQYLGRMFFPVFGPPAVSPPQWVDISNHREQWMLLIGLLFAITPIRAWLTPSPTRPTMTWLRLTAQTVSSFLLLGLAALALVNSHFHPFIYFRF